METSAARDESIERPVSQPEQAELLRRCGVHRETVRVVGVTLRGSLEQVLAARDEVGDDLLRVVLDEPPRPGLADEVRQALPDAVDVAVATLDAQDGDGEVAALDLDAAGNLLVSFRSLSEITKIDAGSGTAAWSAPSADMNRNAPPSTVASRPMATITSTGSRYRFIMSPPCCYPTLALTRLRSLAATAVTRK